MSASPAKGSTLARGSERMGRARGGWFRGTLRWREGRLAGFVDMLDALKKGSKGKNVERLTKWGGVNEKAAGSLAGSLSMSA